MLTALTTACDWTTFGFDTAHTRGTADAGPSLGHPALVDHVWTGTVASGAVSSTPIVTADTVFAITDTGELDAFPATITANTRGCEWDTRCVPAWTAALGPSNGSSPAVENGVVMTSSGDGIVRAFDATGLHRCSGTPRRCTPLWSTAAVGPLESSPLVVGGVLYVGSTDGNLYGYDAHGIVDCAAGVCTPEFRVSVGSPIRSSPIAFGTKIIVGADDGTIASFDPTATCTDTCAPLWTAHEGGPVRDALAVFGSILLVASDTGTLDAYDAAGTTDCTGSPVVCTPLWSATTGSPIHTALAVAEGTVVVGGDDGSLRAYDAAGLAGCAGAPVTCAPKWTTAATGEEVHGAPVIAAHRVFAGWADGRLAAFDLVGTSGCSGTPVTCGPLWTGDVGHDPEPPTIAHGRLFVGAGTDIHAFRTVVRTTADEIETDVLTDDADDAFTLDHDTVDNLVAGAPATNVGTDLRLAFARATDPPSADQSSCATWSGDSGRLDQEGAALRIHAVPGGTKAITITKNVWFSANWIFNVHVWDTSASPVATIIGAFDLRSVFYPNDEFAPFPWRICARVVGSVVSFIAWPVGTPQPTWDDPAYGGSVTLPPGFDDPGRPGWYIGHLRPADHAGFDDLDAGPVVTGAPLGVMPFTRVPPRTPTDEPNLP